MPQDLRPEEGGIEVARCEDVLKGGDPSSLLSLIRARGLNPQTRYWTGEAQYNHPPRQLMEFAYLFITELLLIDLAFLYLTFEVKKNPLVNDPWPLRTWEVINIAILSIIIILWKI